VERRSRFALSSVPAGPLMMVMGIYFLSTFAISGLENTLGLFLEAAPELRYTSTQFGIVVLYLGLVGVITQGFLIKAMARHLREQQVLAIGSALMIVGLGLLPGVKSTATLYQVVSVLFLGYGMVSPSLSSLNALLAPEHIRGEMLGIGQSMASLGRILGPIAGGWLYDTHGHGSPYTFGAVISFCSLILASWLTWRMAVRRLNVRGEAT
jgi:DHA1 family tetracycline resistance protein-like MFS transporter